MKRYIDADKALKQIKALQETDPATVGKKQFAEGFFCGLDEAEVILMRTPGVDVAEVVRCKDCAWRYTQGCNAKHERADLPVVAYYGEDVNKNIDWLLQEVADE
jgi:hypothetical protein